MRGTTLRERPCRAAFATRYPWVTRYDPAQRYAAGDLAEAGGLPAFVSGNQSLEDEDVVPRHTSGSTHFPRPEDWPVMSVEVVGFRLVPVGFFDRNPALDTPPRRRLPAPPGGRTRGTGARALPTVVGRARARGREDTGTQLSSGSPALPAARQSGRTVAVTEREPPAQVGSSAILPPAPPVTTIRTSSAEAATRRSPAA